MTDEEPGCVLSLSPRRAAILELVLEYGAPMVEAIETASTVPDRALRHFYAAREPTADRPRRATRRGRFTAGRR